MNGKGDTPRPLSVPKEDFDAAWERTFGNKSTPFMQIPGAGQGGREPEPGEVATAYGVEDDERHVCGLTGYNPMIDPPCPACMERAARWEENKKSGAGGI